MPRKYGHFAQKLSSVWDYGYAWLGRQDSNLRMVDQNSLPYHLVPEVWLLLHLARSVPLMIQPISLFRIHHRTSQLRQRRLPSYALFRRPQLFLSLRTKRHPRTRDLSKLRSSADTVRSVALEGV